MEQMVDGDLTYGPGNDDIILALQLPKLCTVFLQSVRLHVETRCVVYRRIHVFTVLTIIV